MKVALLWFLRGLKYVLTHLKEMKFILDVEKTLTTFIAASVNALFVHASISVSGKSAFEVTHQHYTVMPLDTE